MCDMREVGYVQGKAEGKAEGIALGKAEGIVLGKAEGKAEIITAFINSLIRKGFSPAQVKLELIDKLELSSDDAENAYNKYVEFHQS